MTVTDVTPYSVVQDMLWAVLQDESAPCTAELLEWRRAQRADGDAGRDFDEGPVPEIVDRTDCPALCILKPAPVLSDPALEGKSVSGRIMAFTIRGTLAPPAHEEGEADRKVMRFQYLVEAAIGAKLRELVAADSKYLPTGEKNPIEQIEPGSPQFPDLSDPNAAPEFEWDLNVTIAIENLWIS